MLEGSSESSSFRKVQFNKGKSKSIHPPIESYWHLPPPQEEYKWFSWFRFSFKNMFTYPLKLRGSINKTGRSQSLRMVLEGTHDPKDEKIVESFREMLLLEGHLPVKHNDYHTLLRYVLLVTYSHKWIVCLPILHMYPTLVGQCINALDDGVCF